MDEQAPERLPRAWLVGGLVLLGLVAVGIIGLLTAGGGDGDAALTPGSLTAPGSLTDIADAPDALPPAMLLTFDGEQQVQVADLLGGVPLIVNFWATWCAPCVAEMPDLELLSQAAGPELRLIGINTNDSPLNAQPFAQELGISYELLVDPDASYFDATNGFGMPTTLFVAPDGAIRWRQTGPMTLEQMTQLSAEHLGVVVDVAA